VLAGLPLSVKEFFASAELPCVVRGYVERELNLPCVYEDMAEVGRMAGELLCNTGRIVALCSEKLVGAESQLITGVRLAAQALGQREPDAEEFHVHLPLELEDYARAIDQLLASGNRPTSILAIRPEYALATVQAAARRGIRIPDELQVVGLHHHTMYRFAYPEITSVGPRSLVELGQLCAELLAGSMGQRPGTADRVVIESTLVGRESTRSASGGRGRRS
jgi:DNA-binding LacI/PurR family transcriptional regulator